MRVFIMILMLLSCGTHKDKEPDTTTPTAQLAQEKGAAYCAKLTDAAYAERCDKLTFKAMVSITCPQSLVGFESGGRWERDTQTCYPEFSKSTISRDGLISVLHYIWTHKDLAMLERFIAYGEAHNWIVGDGPNEFTDAILLMPMSYKMRDKLKGVSLALVAMPTVDEIAQGFKGHVFANYIWLSGRVNGSLGDAELQTVIQFYRSAPTDPMYAAMYHRYVDGDQTETYNLLMNRPEFPADAFPTETSVFGWGSAPSSVYYLFSLAIAEGK